MIHDDKTTEIIISTPTSTLATPGSSNKEDSVQMKSQSTTVTRSGASSQIILTKSSWVQNLQNELSEDWTLRVLAALTILVLSLLVL